MQNLYRHHESPHRRLLGDAGSLAASSVPSTIGVTSSSAAETPPQRQRRTASAHRFTSPYTRRDPVATTAAGAERQSPYAVPVKRHRSRPDATSPRLARQSGTKRQGVSSAEVVYSSSSSSCSSSRCPRDAAADAMEASPAAAATSRTASACQQRPDTASSRQEEPAKRSRNSSRAIWQPPPLTDVDTGRATSPPLSPFQKQQRQRLSLRLEKSSNDYAGDQPSVAAGRRHRQSSTATNAADSETELPLQMATVAPAPSAAASWAGSHRSRSLESAWRSYLHWSRSNGDRESPTTPPAATSVVEKEEELLRLREQAASIAKEAVLLRASLVVAFNAAMINRLPSDKDNKNATAAALLKQWCRQVDHFAAWSTRTEKKKAENEARESKAPSTRVGEMVELGLSTADSPWPELQQQLLIAIHDALHFTTASSTAVVAPAASPPKRKEKRTASPQRLLEYSMPAVKGLPMQWYPPNLSDAVGPVSGTLDLWLSKSYLGITTQSWSSDDDDDGNGNREGRRAGEAANTKLAKPTKLEAAQSRPKRPCNADVAASGLDGKMKPMAQWYLRTCFVVADDRGIVAYRSEEDYVECRNDSILMVVPYRNLAYLIADFGAAAASPSPWSLDSSTRYSSSGMEATSLEQVHQQTIAAVASGMAAIPSSRTRYSFGFLSKQSTSDLKQFPARLHESDSATRPLRFHAWAGLQSPDMPPPRLSAVSGLHRQPEQLPLIQPPLVFSTPSRTAHAEWLHYFAYRFNRRLYLLLFPQTSTAAMVQSGVRSAATQTTMEAAPPKKTKKVAAAEARRPRRCSMGVQTSARVWKAVEDEKKGELPPSEMTSKAASFHSIHSSSPVSNLRRTATPIRGHRHDNESIEEGEERSHRNRAAVLVPSNRAESSAVALVEPLPASFLNTISDLQEALQRRRKEFDALEKMHAATTQLLQQRELQIRDLQEDQRRMAHEMSLLQQSLTTPVEERWKKSTIETLQSGSGASGTATNRNADEGVTKAELEEKYHDLLSRYQLDGQRWRGQRAALETQFKAAEAEVSVLRSEASEVVRRLARQVVHDLDSLHREVSKDVQLLHQPPPPSISVSPPTVADLPDKHRTGIAVLELTHDLSMSAIDGTLIVDQNEATLQLSQPLRNLRGRRWELLHGRSNVMLCVEVQLLSCGPRSVSFSAHHSIDKSSSSQLRNPYISTFSSRQKEKGDAGDTSADADGPDAENSKGRQWVSGRGIALASPRGNRATRLRQEAVEQKMQKLIEAGRNSR